MEPDKGDLLRLVLAGDAQALETIMELYQDRLVRYVSNMGLFEQAEDIVQETFLRLCRPQRHYREIEVLSKYLLAIATNLARSEMRRAYRWKSVLPRFAVSPPRYQPPPDAGLFEDEIRRKVDEAFRNLDPKVRIPLGLYAREDCTYEEIAIITKSRVGTVRSRISSAREQIRAQLADWWIGAAHDRRTDRPHVEKPASQKCFARLEGNDPAAL